MIIVICIVLFILSIIPMFRSFLLNIPRVIFYSIKDIFMYFYKKSFLRFQRFGITLYCGMFGKGKTLSMVHEAEYLYKKYGDSIQFISNVSLFNIPYIPLVNFQQLVDLGEFDSDKQGTVVLIDEIENVLNNRNYAKFPLALLHMLTQQRKKRVLILASAQRFFMVDKLFRSITDRVVDCNKIWRFQNYAIYDAWEYECAVNPKLIKPYHVGCWFVRDHDYMSYSTNQMVTKNSAEQFISNEESLNKHGVIVPLDRDSLIRPRKNRRIKSK